MNFFRKILQKPSVDLEAIIQKGAVIIDVRSPGEFSQGHIKKALNIPLQEIMNYKEKIEAFQKPIIAYCHSGTRSHLATMQLKSINLEAYNGGSFMKMQRILQNDG